MTTSDYHTAWRKKYAEAAWLTPAQRKQILDPNTPLGDAKRIHDTARLDHDFGLTAQAPTSGGAYDPMTTVQTFGGTHAENRR